MITAIVFVRADVARIPEIAEQIAELDAVSEVYSVTGKIDLIAIVRVRAHEQIAVAHGTQAHVGVRRERERGALQRDDVDTPGFERVQDGRKRPEPELVVVPRLAVDATQSREIGIVRPFVDECAVHEREEVQRLAVPERVEIDLLARYIARFAETRQEGS